MRCGSTGMSEQIERAAAALEDPRLRKYLAGEARLDAMEQHLFDLKRRVDSLRSKRPNLAVKCAVKVGIIDNIMRGWEVP